MPPYQVKSTDECSSPTPLAEKGLSETTEDRFPDTRHSPMDAGVLIGTEVSVIELVRKLVEECSLSDESISGRSLPSMLTRPVEDSSLSDESLIDETVARCSLPGLVSRPANDSSSSN